MAFAPCQAGRWTNTVLPVMANCVFCSVMPLYVEAEFTEDARSAAQMAKYENSQKVLSAAMWPLNGQRAVSNGGQKHKAL